MHMCVFVYMMFSIVEVMKVILIIMCCSFDAVLCDTLVWLWHQALDGTEI